MLRNGTKYSIFMVILALSFDLSQLAFKNRKTGLDIRFDNPNCGIRTSGDFHLALKLKASKHLSVIDIPAKIRLNYNKLK